jgi:nitrate/nitrite-specific signal transduction histidine kinase
MSLLRFKERSGSRQASQSPPRPISTVPVVAIGAGFGPEAIQGCGGLGLVGIRERAHLANGKLSIDAKPGYGTCIKLALHLPGSAS